MKTKKKEEKPIEKEIIPARKYCGFCRTVTQRDKTGKCLRCL